MRKSNVLPDFPFNLEVLADTLAVHLAERLRIDADRLIDLRELAGRLGLSPRGTTGLIARGELPGGFLIGGVRRWAWAEVVRFLEARRDRKPRRRRRGQHERRPPQQSAGASERG